MLKELDIRLMYCPNCGALYKEVNQIIPNEVNILPHLSSLPNVNHYADRESWMSRNVPSGPMCGKCGK